MAICSDFNQVKSMSHSTVLKIITGAFLLGSLSACAQYLDHNEGVSLSAGNAVAHNKAVQMIDPWPRYGARTNISANGERMLVGLKKYRENKTEEPEKTPTQGDAKSED